jgi:Cytochrome P450
MVFRGPHDELDLQREDNPHVGFGYGRHQCAGQQLARMELQIVLHTLLRRIPTLRLAVVTVVGSPAPGGHFAAAADKSRLSITQVSKELICKYLTDLKLIGALEK